jgi:hypothetical protein
MKQQTAVEWFMEKIGEKQPNGMHVIDSLEDVANVFQQAKAMEKEQIINAIDSQYNYDKWTKQLPTLGEQYYNETYNK